MEFTKLTDVCDFQGGSQPPKNEWINNEAEGYIRMLQIRDFTQDREEKEFVKITNTIKTCKKDDVLIARYGASVGKILTGLEGAYNVAIMKSIPDENKIDKRYLYYYFKTQYFQHNIRNVGSRAAQAGFNISELDKFDIYVAELDKQKKIVEVLDKAKSLIDKKKEQIELLDELVKSRFADMFGKLHINDKNWNKGVISDYCQVKGGKRVPKGEKLLDEKTDHPYLRVLDLKKGTVLEEDIKYISDEIYEKIKRYVISSDDVYLTNVGEKLGMAGTIPEKFNNANLTENAVKLVFDNNLINKTYLAYYLNSDVCQNYILERKMTVGVPKLAIFRIESLPLILPPIELQNEFAEFVTQTDSIRSKMESSLSELEDNFNSLMQKAFKGELF